MLTGVRPPEPTTPSCSRLSRPSPLTRSTEISLLPASTASRCFPSRVTWSAPCEPKPWPVPAPPAANGEPGIAVSEPSAWRSKPAIVLTPAVLSFTYRCPTTFEPGAAPAVAAPRAASASAAAATAARNIFSLTFNLLVPAGVIPYPPRPCHRDLARLLRGDEQLVN